jgi:hypothetical protein
LHRPQPLEPLVHEHCVKKGLIEPSLVFLSDNQDVITAAAKLLGKLSVRESIDTGFGELLVELNRFAVVL